MGSLADFEAIEEGLKRVGDTPAISEEICKRAAARLEKAMVRNLSAGVSPDGVSWGPTKKHGKDPGGRKAYPNAAAGFSIQHYTDLIRMVLTGHAVFGHFGSAKMQRRQMLPEGGEQIPEWIVKIIQDTAREVVAEMVGAR